MISSDDIYPVALSAILSEEGPRFGEHAYIYHDANISIRLSDTQYGDAIVVRPANMYQYYLMACHPSAYTTCNIDSVTTFIRIV